MNLTIKDLSAITELDLTEMSQVAGGVERGPIDILIQFPNIHGEATATAPHLDFTRS